MNNFFNSSLFSVNMPSSIVVSIVFSLGVSIAVSSCQPNVDPLSADEMVTQTAAYLWSQQQDDGGWHSPVHGIATGGESWTPFILFHLLQVPSTLHETNPGDIDRALHFIRSQLAGSGMLGHNDPIVSDYPNYASSYALRILYQNADSADANLIAQLATYLRHQQMTEARGFVVEDPAYGAWGFGEKHLPSGVPGHVDLSHTRRVLEALRDVDDSDLSLSLALTFLHRVQKRSPIDSSPILPSYDGGFFASTVVPGVNKAGSVSATDSTDAYFSSYATATTDGILALLAAGLPPNDERVVDAYQWLIQYPDLSRPSGIPEDSAIPWDDVMFYYHLYGRAEVYSILGGTDNWQDEIIDLIRPRLQEDHSFANPSGAPNKEDDPLIASTFVLSALLRTIDL